MRWKTIFAAAILCMGVGRAQAQSTKPAAPATQPADPKVAALINQLGDEDPHVRDAALAQLRSLGAAALPALQGATHHEDPQVRTSAECLVAEITGKDKPQASSAQTMNSAGPGVIRLRGGGLVLNNVRVGAGNVPGQMQMQLHVVANRQATRDISVNDNGHKVHIHEDNDGVNVEVTDNGQTKEYKAKNAAELKEKQPEGYKVYEQYGNGGVGQLKIEVAPNQ